MWCEYNTEKFAQLYQYKPLGLREEVVERANGICGKDLNTSITLLE